MQRRELLKIIPASLAGMAGLPGRGEGAGTDTRAMGAQPLAAEVKLYNGTPTLFLNGEPAFAGMCWVSPPSAEGWRDAEGAAAVAKAGIHIYSLDAGRRRLHAFESVASTKPDPVWTRPNSNCSSPLRAECEIHASIRNSQYLPVCWRIMVYETASVVAP